MIKYNTNNIKELEHLFKINLINSATGYKSANLIGTKSVNGQENVAVFSSVVHLGSNPALLGFICRPTTVPRHTYKNIIETKTYTINHIHQDILEDAHHTSAKYPENISEFNKTNLQPEYIGNCTAPFVKNAPVQLELKFIEEMNIVANDTILVIGEIINLYVKEDLLQQDGLIDLSKGKVAAINGLDAYAVPETNIRFEYQRPK
ncbi:flavin reductase family protein [Cellulophaga omnivescoria]|uniref:flavin reductase family protein n=1 Tax=Cellulophaga omnivescoria TaxID=1888890 RepID=UPI0009852DBF|nr:flavin reductase family protein [Cellulophaga omnivescoria]WBU89309.1 flavin reductase family protein [Cellulophaga omnivescoria]WKB81315.1 flavin reductase family protein [Cellulophaga lytica]